MEGPFQKERPFSFPTETAKSVRESVVIRLGGGAIRGPPMWTNENRAKYKRDHLSYPSDLTDEEWAHVEPLIPLARLLRDLHK